MDTLKVELIDVMGSDLTVVNSARVSFGRTSEELTDKDVKLINFLAKNSHFTPFEHCQASFHITCPMPIAVQILRHRTGKYNMISRRYTSKDIVFHTPSRDDFRKQSVSNRQASEGSLDKNEVAAMETLFQKVYREALDAYNTALDKGLCREQARFLLPQGLVTEFHMTMDLRNLAHFVKLRIAKDAQSEVRVIAEHIRDALLEKFPVSSKALLES